MSRCAAANDPTTPVTQIEAEAIALRVLGDYLTACRITQRDQIGDRLMKLVSVAALAMANAEGSGQAFGRLLATAEFVLTHGAKDPVAVKPVH